MDHTETQTHSFIIRIWLEEAEERLWRGHVTHVPSGKRQYVETLEGISHFLDAYLQQMGAASSVNSSRQGQQGEV